MTEALKGIGTRIREIRKINELSQQTLAESAGISYKYLGEIERGDGNLSVQILLKIAGALGVEAEDLFVAGLQEQSLRYRAKHIVSVLKDKDLSLAVDILESLKRHSDN